MNCDEIRTMAHKKRQRLTLFGIVLAVALLATACPSNNDEETLLEDKTICADSGEGGNEAFSVLYAEGRSLYVGTEADGQLLRDAGVLDEVVWQPPFDQERQREFVYSLNVAADEQLDIPNLSNQDFSLRQHIFGLHPSDIGHPVDKPDDGHVGPPDAYDPTSTGSGSGRIAVIDANPEVDNPYADHGVFIVDLIKRMGAYAQLFQVDSLNTPSLDGLFFDEADVISALNQVKENASDFDLVNLSLGSYGCADYGPSGLRAVVESFPIPVVASAGNANVSQEVYPAASPTVVGVGSTTADLSQRSCFSNHGSWVDVWVPGEEVIAKGSDGEVTWSGTSFAAPQVAAMAMAQDLTTFATTDQINPGDAAADWGC